MRPVNAKLTRIAARRLRVLARQAPQLSGDVAIARVTERATAALADFVRQHARG